MSYTVIWNATTEWKILPTTKKPFPPLGVYETPVAARKELIHRIEREIEYLKSEQQKLADLPNDSLKLY